MNRYSGIYAGRLRQLFDCAREDGIEIKKSSIKAFLRFIAKNKTAERLIITATPNGKIHVSLTFRERL